MNRPKRIFTVHWDPKSPGGRIVGYRIRVLNRSDGTWKVGRIIRHDVLTNRHKIEYYVGSTDGNVICSPRRGDVEDEDDIPIGTEWIRLNEEVRLCTNISLFHSLL